VPFSHESVLSITHEQNIIYSKTLICRQLFAGHMVSSRSKKRKEKIHRMMIIIIIMVGVCDLQVCSIVSTLLVSTT